MRIFFSWSGHRSQQLAACFREWLPMVIQTIEPWFSPEDVDKGTRWLAELSGQLADQDLAFLFLTPENLSAPWLIFEAGALSKSLNHGRIYPILFDIEARDVVGPLAQFQSTSLARLEVTRLLVSVNKLSPQPRSEAHLAKLIELTWPDLDGKIRSISAEPAVRPPSRKPEEILDEILARLRLLETPARNDAIGADELSVRLRLLESAVNGLIDSAKPLEKIPDTPFLRQLRLNEQLLVNELERVSDLKVRLEHQLNSDPKSVQLEEVIRQRQELRDLENDVRRELFAVQDKIFHGPTSDG